MSRGNLSKTSLLTFLENLQNLIHNPFRKIFPMDDNLKEAIVNWCWNTEKHLNEARRLKKEKIRLPSVFWKERRWQKKTQFLIAKIWKELHKAEPDTMEGTPENYFHSGLMCENTFLDAIPD